MQNWRCKKRNQIFKLEDGPCRKGSSKSRFPGSCRVLFHIFRSNRRYKEVLPRRTICNGPFFRLLKKKNAKKHCFCFVFWGVMLVTNPVEKKKHQIEDIGVQTDRSNRRYWIIINWDGYQPLKLIQWISSIWSVYDFKIFTYLPLPATTCHYLILPATTCQYLPAFPPATIRHYLHLPLPAATCHCLPLSVTTWLPATTSNWYALFDRESVKTLSMSVFQSLGISDQITLKIALFVLFWLRITLRPDK